MGFTRRFLGVKANEVPFHVNIKKCATFLAGFRSGHNSGLLNP